MILFITEIFHTLIAFGDTLKENKTQSAIRKYTITFGNKAQNCSI